MRVAQHVIDQRRSEISKWLSDAHFGSLSDLCKQFGISEATARRDLQLLQNSGEIRRTHGGALGEYDRNVVSFQQRMQSHSECKDRVAKRAVSLVADGMTLYLDIGNTLFRAARYILERSFEQITIITNNLPAAQQLSDHPGIRLILTGGEFLSRQSTLLGEYTVNFVKQFPFDLSLMSAEGMTTNSVWNSSKEIVDFQQAVMHASHRSALCIDSSKLSVTTLYESAKVEMFAHIVTDAKAADLKKKIILIGQDRLIEA